MRPERELAALAIGDTVWVAAGVGAQRVELTADVVAVGVGTVVLRPAIIPLRLNILAPGAHLQLAIGGAAVEPARVVTVAGGSPPAVTVAPSAALPTTSELRGFFRVPTRLVEAYAGHATSGRAARFRIRIVDLGGGGARIVSPRQISTTDTLTLRLPLLRGQQEREVRGEAIWVRRLDEAWQVGIHFVGLSESDRDLVVRSVFLEELRWREDRSSAWRGHGDGPPRA